MTPEILPLAAFVFTLMVISCIIPGDDDAEEDDKDSRDRD
jgi:hypothetical protein